MPRKLPPVTELCIGAMVLVIIGGIYTAAYLPARPPLALPIALAIGAGLLLLAAVLSLARLREFAWRRFFLVVRWAVLAYIVIAGMLEWVFAVDGTPASIMILLTAMLAIYAVDVPLLFAFSVARYAIAEA